MEEQSLMQDVWDTCSHSPKNLYSSCNLNILLVARGMASVLFLCRGVHILVEAQYANDIHFFGSLFLMQTCNCFVGLVVEYYFVYLVVDSLNLCQCVSNDFFLLCRKYVVVFWILSVLLNIFFAHEREICSFLLFHILQKFSLSNNHDEILDCFFNFCDTLISNKKIQSFEIHEIQIRALVFKNMSR